MLINSKTYKLTWAEFLDCYYKAVDKKIMCAFKVSNTPVEEGDVDKLLDLVAGAASIFECYIEDMLKPGDIDDDEHIPTKDETKVYVHEKLFNILKSEWQNPIDSIASIELSAISEYKMIRCDLCPFRKFCAYPKNFRRDISLHLQRHNIKTGHTSTHPFVISGTKQWRLVCALYDHYTLIGEVPVNLLQKTALIIRNGVKPGLRGNTNCICLLYTSQSPRDS